MKHSNGWLVKGCLSGIGIALVYNVLFINDDLGKLAEWSASEEKATYGIRLFGKNLIIGAALGVAVSVIYDLYLGWRRRRFGNPDVGDTRGPE